MTRASSFLFFCAYTYFTFSVFLYATDCRTSHFDRHVLLEQQPLAHTFLIPRKRREKCSAWLSVGRTVGRSRIRATTTTTDRDAVAGIKKATHSLAHSLACVTHSHQWVPFCFSRDTHARTRHPSFSLSTEAHISPLFYARFSLSFLFLPSAFIHSFFSGDSERTESKERQVAEREREREGERERERERETESREERDLRYRCFSKSILAEVSRGR